MTTATAGGGVRGGGHSESPGSACGASISEGSLKIGVVQKLFKLFTPFLKFQEVYSFF